MSTEAGELTPGPLTIPGGARRARQALPAAARLKLESLETDAEVARVRARTLNDQARTLRDEEQRLARRL